MTPVFVLVVMIGIVSAVGCTKLEGSVSIISTNMGAFLGNVVSQALRRAFTNQKWSSPNELKAPQVCLDENEEHRRDGQSNGHLT